MKPLTVVGAVLAAFGAIVLLRGLTYPSNRSVLKVGDLEVSAEEHRTVPTWVGGIAIVGGLILVGTGVRSRPNR